MILMLKKMNELLTVYYVNRVFTNKDRFKLKIILAAMFPLSFLAISFLVSPLPAFILAIAIELYILRWHKKSSALAMELESADVMNYIDKKEKKSVFLDQVTLGATMRDAINRAKDGSETGTYYVSFLLDYFGGDEVEEVERALRDLSLSQVNRKYIENLRHSEMLVAYYKKDYAAALRIYDKYLADKENSVYVYDYGQVLLAQKKYAEAIEAFNKSAELMGEGKTRVVGMSLFSRMVNKRAREETLEVAIPFAKTFAYIRMGELEKSKRELEETLNRCHRPFFKKVFAKLYEEFNDEKVVYLDE